MSIYDYNQYRRNTRKIKVGDIYLGGDAPIAIQSMANAPAEDIGAVVSQCLALQKAGCEIVRIAVPTVEAARAIPAMKESGVTIPVVADIHYDYRIALECASLGVDKIRINPGNIGEDSRVKAVATACAARNIPIRIGVNSGSLEKSVLEKYGAPTAEALAESAMYHASLLEKFDFNDIIISIKASTPREMVRANRILAEHCDYPLHLGVTEAGGADMGRIKSAVGIGALLCDGIGDTIRVSLTADPTDEIGAAKAILRASGCEAGATLNIVSCPTCGRTKIDLISLAAELERRAGELRLKRSMKVAVMGCAVNGPGEAREADIGIAGGRGEAVLIRRGEIIRKIGEGDIIEVLLNEIKKMQEIE